MWKITYLVSLAFIEINMHENVHQVECLSYFNKTKESLKTRKTVRLHLEDLLQVPNLSVTAMISL